MSTRVTSRSLFNYPIDARRVHVISGQSVTIDSAETLRVVCSCGVNQSTDDRGLFNLITENHVDKVLAGQAPARVPVFAR